MISSDDGGILGCIYIYTRPGNLTVCERERTTMLWVNHGKSTISTGPFSIAM